MSDGNEATDQPSPQPALSNDPPRIGEIRELFGIKLRWNGSQWQKVTTQPPDWLAASRCRPS